MTVADQPPVHAHQDAKTVWRLRLGVGMLGISLPVLLIAWNWFAGDKVVVPESMSGSYYTSARNLFVGLLCALGVFLILYRHTKRQDVCTWFAGLFAVVVAFAPTAPSPPQVEPGWVSYLHHGAAGALIFTLGLFCFIVFAHETRRSSAQPRSQAGHLRSWVTGALDDFNRDSWSRLYLICGFTVTVSGFLALITGIWPASWSTGWPSLFLFEAIAVAAFGVAWTAAGWKMRADHNLGPAVPADFHDAEPGTYQAYTP
jgi:hypothetical protein